MSTDKHKRGEEDTEHTDALARRDKQQSHDYKGEAQNVRDGDEDRLSKEGTEHAKNKSNEGIRQGRARGTSPDLNI